MRALCLVPLLAALLGSPLEAAHAAANAPTAFRGDSSRQEALPRESLQDFLRRLKSQQAGKVSELKAGLDRELQVMESDAIARRLEALEQGKARLVAMGLEAAPLLVEALDPGSGGTDAQKLCAQFVVRALQDLKSRAVTDRLIVLAQTGSPDGRRNAIRVLGHSPEPERATPVLVGILRSQQADLRGETLVALAFLGTAEAEKALGDSLADANPAVVRGTILALASARSTALSARILRLVEVPRDAVQYIDALVHYYRNVPEAADKRHVLAVLHLAQDFSPPPELRVKLLELVPLFGDRVDADGKKVLKELGESPTKEVKEAALVALVLLGDKNARKDLFVDVEIQIERNKNYAQNYEQRARLLYRIEEWRDASRDYQTALKLSANDFRARPEECYIGLARCYMQLNKLKEAKDTLEKAPISLKELQELAKEPVFQKLVENPKYKTVFRLE